VSKSLSRGAAPLEASVVNLSAFVRCARQNTSAPITQKFSDNHAT